MQGNESITKQELLDFVEQKNIADKLKVVKVPTEDQYDFTQFSLGGASSARATRMLSEGLLSNLKGYKSSVKQYVFQVDGPAQWSADPNHFPEKYAKNAQLIRSQLQEVTQRTLNALSGLYHLYAVGY